ncbi:hypothetical protein ABT154_08730 [Streptomyces sp. NPDC001728]|uniref:hypothetical protein n=1 Tax=Streptomyces sp. NPDC001728 TaxID=3154396 RepID=UPI0033222A9E
MDIMEVVSVDDEAMFVRTEALPQSSLHQHMTVQVHTPIGSAVVLWHGDPPEADGRHHVEWTVGEDIHWGRNAQPALSNEPEVRQEGDRVIVCGLLHLYDDGVACLQMGHWTVLFDVASPVPDSMDESWVEISVGSENIALCPYQV